MDTIFSTLRHVLRFLRIGLVVFSLSCPLFFLSLQEMGKKILLALRASSHKDIEVDFSGHKQRIQRFWVLRSYEKDLGGYFQSIGQRYDIYMTKGALISQETLWHHKEKYLKKTKIRLDFFVKNDDNFWLFFQHLHQSFPGIIISLGMTLRTTPNSLKKRWPLKGSYQFECYTLCVS